MVRVVKAGVWSVVRLVRAGAMEPNPQVFRQRAGVFTRSASQQGQAGVVVTRDEQGMQGWVVVDGQAANPDTVGRHAGASVGARAERVEAGLPGWLADVPVVGWLTAQRFSQASRDTLQGADPAELSRVLGRMLPPGSWVAVSFRQPGRLEISRWRRWLSHRLGVATPTDHSMGSEAVAVSIFAGGASPAVVSEVLSSLAASLPGFAQATHARVVSARDVGAEARRLAVFCSVLALALVGVRLFVHSLPVLDGWSGWAAAGGIAAVAAVCWLVAWLLSSRRLSSWAAQVLDFGSTGVVPSPPHRIVPPRAPRQESTRMVGDEVRKVAAFAGDYPFHEAVFLVGPEVFVGVVAPQAGVVSGETETTLRQTPAAVLNPSIGPVVGDAAEGSVYLSAADLRLGFGVTGGPGSGKTAILEAMWGWSCAQRMFPVDEPGWPGSRNALIAFDSKGSGTARLTSWTDAAGDEATVVDILDPAAPTIDLFAGVDSAQRGVFLTRAMQYGFADGDIRGRSLEVLQAVVCGGLAVDDEVLAVAAEMPGMSDVLTGGVPNPVALAHWLCGGVGDEVAGSLFAAINAEATRRMSGSDASAADRVLLDAALQLRPFFAGVAPAARRSTMEAARNKLSQLRPLDAWWDGSRESLSWRQVLDEHRAVVINFGRSVTGAKPDEGAAQVLSAMLFYGLKQTISMTCDGWESQGRWVSIFSDELSLQAGGSPEVFTWLRDQGRSYGVRLFLATQRPAQLEPRVRLAFLTLATLMTFKQEATEAADDIAKQMALHPGDWTGADILTLPIWTAAIRTQVGQVRQEAFTARVRNFGADLPGSLQAWGVQAAARPSARHDHGSALAAAVEDDDELRTLLR